jgi:hypothetical protein
VRIRTIVFQTNGGAFRQFSVPNRHLRVAANRLCPIREMTEDIIIKPDESDEFIQRLIKSFDMAENQ